MEITIIFKIAAVGLLITLLNQLLKTTGREDHTFFVSLAGFVLIVTWMIPYLTDFFAAMKTMFSM
ncbi:MAG: stage III sporulation protein AC [Lachnospiraceae bacterium]|nr:stage III sporulation protein AC [Lachnospiraceae bacterium]